MKRWLIAVLLFTCSMNGNVPIHERIDPRGLIMRVELVQIAKKSTDAISSWGDRDTTEKQVRALKIECRLLGVFVPKPATLQWYFMGRDGASGKIAVVSQGEHSTGFGTLPTTIIAESEPLETTVRHTIEGLTRVRTRSGVRPHGWVVVMHQNGSPVKVLSSSDGLTKHIR